MVWNCGKSAVILHAADPYHLHDEAPRCLPQSEYPGVFITPAGVSDHGLISRLDKVGRVFFLRSRATSRWNSDYNTRRALFKTFKHHKWSMPSSPSLSALPPSFEPITCRRPQSLGSSAQLPDLETSRKDFCWPV